ncbi:30S ribosomal protein S17 [Fervidicoccus fontis]|uniref:Small ribosomal subunit protein uS17 n=2 Tax=Fervidicoccus fontis TaxID=683846 RepID=I0A0J4_FERFK|nr:30S ribosomal protein S17 [Fervidicoccus fontis]AFH42501.1 30S ribosomal protein S17P [Fervidicoccus fontis Kam940]MBE9391114.1 30S ribosomal protein S17 [Fervidicoccus fontis]PMB75726.1 MAG: 30S ribosomal protein S17 [Fervidicoccus fontis]PMB78112.1 MAG: 30S ribosomal protein S17 [Fervidicoccus fontis]HEW64178.1 30S ribosomal protein S17 [Fervidicoccus fontis]
MGVKKEVKNPGIPGVSIPEKKCNDPNCPFHGTIKVRGMLITGKVVSDKMDGTVVVVHDYLYYDKKYKRYEKRKSKIHAHVSPCLDVKIGDTVIIGETRPISKTVSFVVLGKPTAQG